MIGGFAPFLEQFQFRNTFKVFRPAGRAFGADQSLQIQNTAFDAKCLGANGMFKEIFITAAPGDLSEQIDQAEVSCHREIQTGSKCRRIEPEWQTRRSSSKIRMEASQRGNKVLEVVGAAAVDNIDILRKTPRAMRCRGDSANQDKINARGTESAQKLTKICHVL